MTTNTEVLLCNLASMLESHHVVSTSQTTPGGYQGVRRSAELVMAFAKYVEDTVGGSISAHPKMDALFRTIQAQVRQLEHP